LQLKKESIVYYEPQVAKNKLESKLEILKTRVIVNFGMKNKKKSPSNVCFRHYGKEG
jgi:hypothetical protein